MFRFFVICGCLAAVAHAGWIGGGLPITVKQQQLPIQIVSPVVSKIALPSPVVTKVALPSPIINIPALTAVSSSNIGPLTTVVGGKGLIGGPGLTTLTNVGLGNKGWSGPWNSGLVNAGGSVDGWW